MRKISKIAKPAATVKPVAAVAAKPVIAASGTKPDRVAIAAECRAYVAKLYSGASLTVHHRKPCTLSAYTSHIATPVHVCGSSGASQRDHSLLALIASKADASGAFDPVAILADLGVISRLASVHYLAMRGDTPVLTDLGAERARLIAKRAA